ncbi:hypothetical protein BBP40_000491 [Aspergillus hancockii]|nr:hypothetical protein BBP40_000491 [Aspergillus hancockii]
MSSSSLYEPEEDDEASDLDVDTGITQAVAPPSSFPRTRWSSLPGPDRRSTSKRPPKLKRRTRTQALEELQLSMSKESVEAYSSLFTHTQDDHSSIETKTGGENHQSTQSGIVIWTSREKEILFNILDRKGKDGIPDIARAIGSKSELEVQEHLRLLHRGVQWQHQNDRHSRTIILGDVPAATEMSIECCDMLDEYAKHLALREQQDEDVAGRKKHHNMWIIDRDTAKLVNEQIKSQDKNLPSSSSLYHTAGLLNIPNWIQLSEHCFMNFGGDRLEDNWVNMAYANETPSVTADALADFYALTVSVTRRLIRSALFFAMSRLRNMRETGNPKAKVVRSRDVKTALDVLGMKRDRYDYWVGLARRCRLEVSDFRHRKGWKSIHLDHDEVEAILSGEMPFDTESNRSTSRQRSESSGGSETEGEYTAVNSEYDSGSELKPESSPGSSTLSSPEVSDNEEEYSIDLEDAHAEQLDQKSSCLDEAEVWKALGQPAPASVVPVTEEDKVNQLSRPVGERKTAQDLVDWRGRTIYRSDWEEYGHEVYDIYEEISEQRRKRRRFNISRDQSPSSNDGIVNQSNEVIIDPIFNKVGQNPDDEIHPSEDNHEGMEMDDPSAPDQDSAVPQNEDHGSETSGSDSQPKSMQHKQQPQCNPISGQKQTNGSDASSAPASPTKNNIGYRSPILARRRRIKVDPKQEDEEANSSSSDDDLSLARRKRDSSSSEDDKNGMPLHSQPMSPTD